ncbi:MAG TPA: hypothetical protein VHO70_08370, partial [Chitinispirillaceae bacterium]|nr:hypothetical protein [Chitinispirillaceae bacterium]
LAKDTIVNTILWDNNGEISDTTTDITYSCVRNGYRGIGNISSYPDFMIKPQDLLIQEFLPQKDLKSPITMVRKFTI